MDTTEFTLHLTPTQRLPRPDQWIQSSMSVPFSRLQKASSVQTLADMLHKDETPPGRLTIRAKGVERNDETTIHSPDDGPEKHEAHHPPATRLSIGDLPSEVLHRVLDFIFGEVHSINLTSTSLRGKHVSSSMRHPRRKAVSDLALVCGRFRDLVQERIYRHIKLKGTVAGITESKSYFVSHSHLTKYVRHIEFWVPVWGDRTSLDHTVSTLDILTQAQQRHLNPALAHPHDDAQHQSLMVASDPTAFFKRSINSATLSEIFSHTKDFFPSTRIFTLEGGHCKKSNMIRHFRNLRLFSSRELAILPQIRTFAMRGTWNIMREYSDWRNIQNALPNVEEWHCGYAKPRSEAYIIINQILLRIPMRLRHVNISLDGMYSKDTTTLSSSHLSPSTPHLCECLGQVALQLESLSYTGKVCSCFWTAAARSLASSRTSEVRLRSLEIVVKSCCRHRVTSIDPETGESITEELGGVMADGASITNLTFIKAFERLILSTVESLDNSPLLEHIRIRFVDLDSPCALLNPYFQLQGQKLTGLWSEEILNALRESRRGRDGLGYVELSDGIYGGWGKERGIGLGGASDVYPKKKPLAIKSSVYRVVAEMRGT